MKNALTLLTLALAGCGPNGAKIQFTASGEVLALGGYDYPPVNPGDPDFVDGWEVRFEKLLVTLDRISLYENPDTSPTDQSKTGKKVAEADGPWALDLHRGGPLTGKGGSDEQAYPIVTLDNQNLNGKADFDVTQRYGFGFDLVPATASATRLQLGADDADYAEMIANGYVVLYVGTATWKGDSTCQSSVSGYDFSAMPKVVHFKLGFKSPTTYLNCQNPDLDPAKPLGGEEHERGVQPKAHDTVIAQVTVHTDHPFWESFTHDSPAHFDSLAALAVNDGSGNFSVRLEAAKGVNYTAFSLGAKPLPWRWCDSTYAPPNTAAQMGFDSLAIPYQPSGDPSAAMRDFYDYLTYDQSTQGHLNSDGLCFVQRNYASPP